MLATSRMFGANARAGLADENLQQALGLARTGFPLRRRLAIDRLPEFEALRETGRLIKDHTLQHLDFYLGLYESKVLSSGGKVHWASTPQEACAAVLQICRSVGDHRLALGDGLGADRHQGQVDGRRGSRPQRIPRSERDYAGRDRSR